MSELLSADLIDQYKQDGAVLIKGKFDRDWIENSEKESLKILKILAHVL